MQKAFLSIVIPTYNRRDLLKRLFESIVEQDYFVEVVVVDDGSTDGTRELCNNYFGDKIKLVYMWQENSGRAHALKKGILMATGQYTILMDSDDFFTHGALHIIASSIQKMESLKDTGKPLTCLVFGVEITSGQKHFANIPPASMTNFTALRADHGVKLDLKEVVRTDVIQANIFSADKTCRRVPTGLLWSKIAENNQCLAIPHPVAVKEYLPGGMSDRILALKVQNPVPLVELYALLSESKAYTSRSYRWRSRLLWARYAHHANMMIFLKWWHALVWLPGLVLYCNDVLKLVISSHKIK
ncbi:Glycosyl transferase family 2 [Desulfonatronum thiosulfatophilum]|uniref:Glycosyl transferase family 2 n=2 Tax=Desulfonatronum thiosulfatophilum TaxID=617002 RepID=A0A1G6EBX4_9BACT|nr:Glycosyl transferase family 2 [Desulfonatronum thiosulfatophilum]